MLSKQEDIEIETPILPFKPFIETDADNNNNIKEAMKKGSEFGSTASEGSTPSTQRSIPPPTVQPATYIVTTTATENPSPTRRFHSIRR